MSRQEIDEFLREFDQEMFGTGFFPDVSKYMDSLMGTLNNGFSSDKALQGKKDANAPEPKNIEPHGNQRFGNIMDFMREQMTRSQEMFKQVWDHFEDLKKNGPPADGKTRYQVSEMRHVALPGGVSETKTFERNNEGEKATHVRQLDGQKITENYAKNYETGKEDRSRQLDGVGEGDVDAFYHRFQEKYSSLGNTLGDGQTQKRLT